MKQSRKMALPIHPIHFTSWCKKLADTDEGFLINSGCGYYTSGNTFNYLFSKVSEVVIRCLDSVFNEHYATIALYNTGAALEYYFFMKVMQSVIVAKFYGKGFSITGNTQPETEVRIRGTAFEIQDSLNEAIKIENNSTTVIKLIEGHDAIDFIVISRVLTNDSQKNIPGSIN